MTACQRCGACCTHLIVEADALDCLREPRLLDADVGNAKHGRPLTLDEMTGDDARVVLLVCGERCPFLRATYTPTECGIYPTRPNECVAFEPGSEQCTQARADAGLPPINQESP